MLFASGQGVEFLSTGRLTLPMHGPDRNACMDVRLGKWSLSKIVSEIEKIEGKLDSLLGSSLFRRRPIIQRSIVSWLRLTVSTWGRSNPAEHTRPHPNRPAD